jgi:predicted enzyme related to lactoylglutathione lyase
MPVLGIGGLFFRARDPDALSAWYRDTLGIGAGCDAHGETDPGDWFWRTKGGPVVFAPFPENSDYFPAQKSYMLNLRVSDIDALLTGLRAAGVEVTTNPDWDTPETGRFARIHDPEGNPIELWEPPVEPS